MEAFAASWYYLAIMVALTLACFAFSDDAPFVRLRAWLRRVLNRVTGWAGSLFGASESVRAEMAEARRRTTYPLEPTDENATKAMENGGRCFHCGEKDIWLAGPEGGMSQNLRCMNCGQMVNHHGPLGTDVLGVEYIMRAAYEQSGRVRADRRQFPYQPAPDAAPAIDPAVVQACLEAPIVLEPEEIIAAQPPKPTKGQRAIDL